MTLPRFTAEASLNAGAMRSNYRESARAVLREDKCQLMLRPRDSEDCVPDPKTGKLPPGCLPTGPGGNWPPPVPDSDCNRCTWEWLFDPVGCGYREIICNRSELRYSNGTIICWWDSMCQGGDMWCREVCSSGGSIWAGEDHQCRFNTADHTDPRRAACLFPCGKCFGASPWFFPYRSSVDNTCIWPGCWG
jgi:hypothetical protein